MSPTGSKYSTNSAPREDSKRAHDVPLSMIYKSELLWWPYRSFTRFLLPSYRNTAAFVQINRNFVDEIRDILRREQNFMFEQSEKFLRQASEEHGSKNGGRSLVPETIEEFYKSTIDGVHEFAKAVTDAQVRSIEALREHSRDLPKTKTHGDDETRAAA